MHPRVHGTLRTAGDGAEPKGDADRGYLASLDDEPLVADCGVLVEMMQRISGEPPRLWNAGTLGFGRYRYRYHSGRTGESHTIGFHRRKGKITPT